MKIKITEQLRPFSHTPGAACLVPGTHWVISAFPTLLRIGEIEVRLHLTGPVVGFTIEQDLERNCVWIYGKAKEGFYRLRVEGSDAGFALTVERGSLRIDNKLCQAKDRLFFPAEVDFVLKTAEEKLFLGNHKAQDWDQVRKRSDLPEFLPTLFCLGQKIPLVAPQPLRGTARLLEWGEERTQLAPALTHFFQAAFASLLVPRLIDDQYQGLAPEEPPSGNPAFLLQEGARRIRSLFFAQEERRLQLLPRLPIPLDAGRMIGLQASGIGEIDLEWTKKTVRRVILRASTSGEILLDLKGIEQFRVNKELKQKATEPLLLQAGKTYHLDRFQK